VSAKITLTKLAKLAKLAKYIDNLFFFGKFK